MLRTLPLLFLLGCNRGLDTLPGDTADTGTPVEETGDPNSTPLPGWGAINGDCDVLGEQELVGAEPAMFGNILDLESGEPDPSDLTAGGQEILSDGNAGGSSIYSEIFAYEVLARCEFAELVKTENEINYQDPNGKKTDLIVSIDNVPIGVSVTRAVGWPQEDPWTPGQALELLEDKFQDIQDSSANVTNADAWAKQILHVIAFSAGHGDSLSQAYNQSVSTDSELVRDTLLMVTVTDGDDAFLY
ncbi:MAG: hypothetical protein VX519_02930 [Myxococcota bacterium]|nr:hypothetical protein [Myxococcota bacterium]